MNKGGKNGEKAGEKERRILSHLKGDIRGERCEKM
jgi:hypothetical protein